jgi:hypothetical protein
MVGHAIACRCCALEPCQKLPVDLSGFLKQGDKFVVKNVADFLGKPVAQTTYQSGTIDLPIPDAPAQPAREFAVFVLIRKT